MNNFDFDLKYYEKGISLLAGVDEAGRGPLAGPVVAAAVIFEKGKYIEGIKDSKKLTEKKREELFEQILTEALAVEVAIIEVKEIEKLNILNAALKAMKTAVEKLNPKPEFILIDGNKKFTTNIPAESIVKGDAKSFVIGAASIVAKVTRDRIMRELDKRFPEYYWAKNKGYGTKQHIEAIKKYGVTEHHRKLFLRKIFPSDEPAFL